MRPSAYITCLRGHFPHDAHKKVTTATTEAVATSSASNRTHHNTKQPTHSAEASTHPDWRRTKSHNAVNGLMRGGASAPRFTGNTGDGRVLAPQPVDPAGGGATPEAVAASSASNRTHHTPDTPQQVNTKQPTHSAEASTHLVWRRKKSHNGPMRDGASVLHR